MLKGIPLNSNKSQTSPKLGCVPCALDAAEPPRAHWMVTEHISLHLELMKDWLFA